MANKTPITVAYGDGIGPEIMKATLRVLESAGAQIEVETIEIENLNPLVFLGNDTTICEGESVILDAGNVGATYVWSNSQVTTQTREVTQAGLYVVNVTAANGCVGVGSINIDVMGAPTASTIYVENNMPSYTFTILNPQNADQYSWDFGDGMSEKSFKTRHVYGKTGIYEIKIKVQDACGERLLKRKITV